MPYTTHAAPQSAGPTTSTDSRTDQELSTWLDGCLAVGHRVAYLHGDYLCKVVDLDEPGGTLSIALTL